ncbi:hypothetical protein ACI2L1_32055 [Streptomyces sp. NPDC019531]|uniref:hypothetical protein n=1 Tax=Streptomyces sp. NPDC019531 TaxID=3365062 RepID=UPI0038511E27
MDKPGKVAAVTVAEGDVVINYDAEGLAPTNTQQLLDGLHQDDELLSGSIRTTAVRAAAVGPTGASSP